MRHDRTAVASLAAAVERAIDEDPDLNYNNLAFRLWGQRPGHGWGTGDPQRLKRRLGLATSSPGSRGGAVRSTTINYDLAVQIMRAAGIDPVDADL